MPTEDQANGLQTATQIILVTFGAAAREIGQARLAELPPAKPVTDIQPESLEDLAPLHAALGASSVGVRILVVGSESEVYAARAAALRDGVLDEELVLEVVDARVRRVYCAHCGHISLALAAESDVVQCPSCKRNLVIYYHFSARKGAYLGYMVDAEDPQ